MTDLPRFLPRLHLMTGVFFLLLVIISCRALQLAWISREDFIRAGKKIALRSGRIPARRGELRDRKNVLLAWNERHFELWTTLTENETFSSYQLDVLRKKFPARKFPISPGNKAPLFFRLTPREVMDLEPLIKSGFPLKIHSRVSRFSLNAPGLREKIGTTENGIGISGWEKQYDRLLQGKDGRYSVLLDRRGNWIPASWKILKKPVHGQNVTVPYDAFDPAVKSRRRKR